mmetsp:Transcript_25513/g.73416  ORF Transcript_25513/g.73416 Transcript_25513/m.73416 type:complete len:344 (-) Transcript_25513:25-1056(-)
MKTVVNVKGHTSDGAGHWGAQEETRRSNIIAVKVLCQRSVGLGIVDGIFDESLLTRLLSNGGSGSGFERSSTDGVDTDFILSSSFVGKSSGITLELGLGRRHTTTISRNDLFRSNVRQRKCRSTRVHDGAELLDKRHKGVSRGRRSGQVSLSAGFKKRLGDFGTVGKGMNKDINLSVVLFDGGSNLRDSVSLKTIVTLVVLNVFRNILRGIKYSIKRVNLFDDHLGSVGKSGILVKLTLLHSHFENLQNRRPGSYDNGGSSISQSLGNSPTVSSGISYTSDESNLSFQIRTSHHGKFGLASMRRSSRGYSSGNSTEAASANGKRGTESRSGGDQGAQGGNKKG